MISLPTAGYTAYDGDVRNMKVSATINLAAYFLDPSLVVNLLAGGDFFGTKEQIANDISVAPDKRLVLGTSKFEDNHILMGTSIECGWTSTELSGAGASFSTSPSIEIVFSSRTVEQLKMYGDDKWEEYPVDFTIDLYYSGSYANEVTVTGNTDLAYVYSLPTARTGVTKVKLTVSKWSKVGVPCKIYELSAGRIIELTADDMIDMYILEEDNYKSGDLPIAKLSANQLSLQFYNNDDVSIAEMKPNKQANVNLIATASSTDYTVPMGTYYAKEWNIDTLNNTLNVIFFDLMGVLADDIYNATIQENQTAYDLVDDILSSSQLLPSSYIIDTELKDSIIPVSLFNQATQQKALAQIIAAVLGSAYVNRSTGQLVILGQTASRSSGISEKTFTNASTVLPGTTTPIELDRIATVVDVIWSELITNTAENVIESTEEIEVPAGESEQVILTYPTDYLTVDNISTPTFTQSGSDITLSSYTAYVWGVVCNFANSGGTDQNIESITVNGQPVTRVKHVYSMEDEDAINDYGRITYEYDNLLVQSRTRAAEIAENILDDFADPANLIINNLWGAPYLIIGDTITVPSTDGTEIVQLERQEMKFNNSGFSHKITSRIVG